MTSLQESSTRGLKSTKFVTANPLDPMLRPFAANDDGTDEDPHTMLANRVNERLGRAMQELQVKHHRGQANVDHPDRAPTGSAYKQYTSHYSTNHHDHNSGNMHLQNATQYHVPQPNHKAAASNRTGDRVDSDDDDDDDLDAWLDGYEDKQTSHNLDDDEVLQTIRDRRMVEIRQQMQQRAELLARGHGELRTITQDEFLPECCSKSSSTVSEWVAVHFFHKDYERCKLLDHHLQIVAQQHVECKFVRIDAEKTPFFVHKLSIRILPTLLVLRRGIVVHRLVGFTDLLTQQPQPKQRSTSFQYFSNSDTKKNDSAIDEWKTSALQRWLAQAGAIQYHSGSENDIDDGDDSG